VNVTDLPDGETVVILTTPSTTPSQCSAISPLWQTYSPWLYSRTAVTRLTRALFELRLMAQAHRSMKSLLVAVISIVGINPELSSA
jgi:hypothetical protein